MAGVAMSPGGDYLRVHPFTYTADWKWSGAQVSTDPKAIPFGPQPWAIPQGLIRATPGPDLTPPAPGLPKGVRYLPVKRRDGIDQHPTLIISIQLLPPLREQNLRVPSWEGTPVDVEVFNRHPVGGGAEPKVLLHGKLDSSLACRIEVKPDAVKAWLGPKGTLKALVNENLLDFKFTLKGVIDSGKPVSGQSRSRLFLYCRKTIVFLPGLFGSQVQFTTPDGQVLGFPDFWDDPRLDPAKQPQMYGAPTFNPAIIPSRFQRVDVLECDDKGVPLIPCPKPTLLMLMGVVTSPFKAVHEARMKLLPKVPEDFRLYTLITYPYDWRADLTDAAAALIKHINGLRTAATGLTAAPDTDDQVAVIGHSTGGVVIRRALAPIAGSECSSGVDPAVRDAARPPADKLINFAFFLSVPFAGAPKAGSVLLTGRVQPGGDNQIPFIVPESLVAISLSMPIVYHLHTSAQYGHRPSTSPSRPPGASLDNEADKEAFVTDALAAGLMPRPWIVKASAATAPDHRQRLALGAQQWHQLVDDLHQRTSGHSLVHAVEGAWGRVKWFEDEVKKRNLKGQMDVRAPLGWNTYLAGRAKAFHEKSVAAVTGPWKSRAAIFWGSCKKSDTLRQLNLTKVGVQTYADVLAYMKAKQIIVQNIATHSAYSSIKSVNSGGFQGGAQDIVQWAQDDSTKVFTETRWKLDWLTQYDAGDGTVPSDSQLAEAKNVDKKLLTVVGKEPPEHMDSTKSDEVWFSVVKSLHLGHIVEATGAETAPLPRGLKLPATGIPAGLVFHGP